MRVLIDTNILISSALRASGTPFRAYCKADVLLTGDKDFLESGIEHPIILTAAEFLRDDI